MALRFRQMVTGLIVSVLFTTFSEACYGSSGREILSTQTLKHDLTLKPDYDTGNLEGISKITILNSSQESITRVPLILYHMLQVESAHTSDDGTLAFTQHVVPMKGHEKMLVNYIEIALDEPLSPGETVTLATQYRGKLAGYMEAGNLYVKDRVSGEFTIFRLDCLAYPVVCYPSAAAFRESAHRDIREGWDYLLEVTVPESFVVANGGKLIGKTHKNGDVTYSYQNIKPAWRIDACVAKYGVVQDEKASLRVFFLPDHEEQARTVLDALLRSLLFFSECFAPLRDFEGFAVIEVPDGYGSQADVTCILLDAEAFRGNLSRLYHEVSHLWNPPCLDEHPSRFESEGLARFFEYWLPEKLDKKTGQLQRGLEICRKRFRDQCKRDPKYIHIPLAHYGRENCTDASYTKGMIAFWLLFRIVGEEAFIDIYRSFHQEYRDKGATLEDFRRTAERVSGKDLQKFFEDWVFGTQSSRYLLGDLSLEQILKLYVVEQSAPAD